MSFTTRRSLFTAGAGVASSFALWRDARAQRAGAGQATGRGTSAEADKLNEWTVGIAGGPLDGAPLRVAAEVARVCDDGDRLQSLAIVTRGVTHNINCILYLKNTDAGVIYGDSLEEFKDKIPDIKRKIAYIARLFPAEMHLVVRPEINRIEDLAGKKVSFNTRGTAASYSGPLIMSRLGIRPQEVYEPHPVAMEMLKAGQLSGVGLISSKPIDSLTRTRLDPGFKILPIEWNEKLQDLYLPTTLTSRDYPGIIAEGQEVPTVAVSIILAAYNWPKNSDRYRRVERLTQNLFDRLELFQRPGFIPGWREVNLAASISGMTRFPAAEEWLAKHPAKG